MPSSCVVYTTIVLADSQALMRHLLPQTGTMLVEIAKQAGAQCYGYDINPESVSKGHLHIAQGAQEGA
jgi:hypothetical protein